MNRFAGTVGFAKAMSTQDPDRPGVFRDEFVERTYYGTVHRNFRNLERSDELNPNFRVNNSISIIADDWALSEYSRIRYVYWGGVAWKVTSVEVRAPRLILQIGEVFNGIEI